MPFDRGAIMAPIGKPISIGGVGGMSDSRISGGFMPQPAFDPSALERQIGGLQEQIGALPSFDSSQFLTKGDLPTAFDDRALRDRIGAIEDRYSTGFDELNRNIGNIPSFDDSTLRDRLQALEGREIPQFDPSKLQSGIAGLQEQIGNFSQFDPSQLQNRLKTLEGRELPKFNPQDFRDDFLSIAREGVQMPEYKAPDLSGFARKEDIPSFDREAFRQEILNELPTAPVFDREALIRDVRGGINIPKPPSFDREALRDELFEDIRGRIKVPEAPIFDRDALIKDIRSGIDIPKPPPFDRQKLIEDIRGGINIPQAPDLSAFDTRFADMQKRIDELSLKDPRATKDRGELIEGIVPGGGGIDYGPGIGGGLLQAPTPTGGLPLDTSLIPQREILEKPIIPPRRDDFMSIERIDEDQRIPRMTNEEPVLFTPPPSPVIEPVQPAPTEPAAVAPTAGAVPAQTQMPMGAIDPVLLQQQTSEKLTDPLIRSLYFGTQDSPGFFQQLQQAGSNLIGSDVPLQQTAGLTPLELLARQQAVAGIGGFEPFLQQNRDLVNQAIEQSRRAEGLQDPYYTQAEEIYKDTMGAYDPSMTQQFYNPYEDAVVQQTIEDVMKAGDKQDIAARAREISSGAFGGSRARLGAEERRQDLGEGLAKALSGIRQTGFQSAQATGLGEFARQQAAKRTGAQGLMGIGVGRGSAASDLGRQLAGYGSQIGGLGSTQEQLRAGQRGELAGFGSTGRGIAETGLGRIFEQQVGQQYRPIQTLGQIGSMLPGYQASQTQIDSGYGMPTDPSAAGLGAAFSAYGALAPRQGQS